MKSLTLLMVTSLFLVAAPSATYAGLVLDDPVLVPEPSALLIWAGIAGASGMIYWWRKRR